MIGKGLSKEEQLGLNIVKIDKKDKDKVAKLLLCCLYVADKHMDEVNMLINNYDFEHIKNKGPHPQLRYMPSNWQLLDRITHRHKTDSGKYTDYRDNNIRTLLTTMDKLFNK